jgi:hypothetical protein
LPDKNDRDWRTPHCSFCDKSQQEVGGLVAGPKDVFICNECTDLCSEILADNRAVQPMNKKPVLPLKDRLAIFARDKRRKSSRHRLMTANLASLGVDFQLAARLAVRSFSEFSKDNDPHNEHDFGAFELQGQKVFWKIDYYDRSLQAGSENPADPFLTCRVSRSCSLRTLTNQQASQGACFFFLFPVKVAA